MSAIVVVETDPGTCCVVVEQVQGPAGSASPGGFQSVVSQSGNGTVTLVAGPGRNLVLVSGLTGALILKLPAAPYANSSYVFKMKDQSMTVSGGAHTLQISGNGQHVEWVGANDAGGIDLSPVFGTDNFGAPGGGSVEYVYTGTQWVSI
jgi:hypothetical protein